MLGVSIGRGIRLVVPKGRLNLNRRGVVPVRVSCPATESDGCKGTLTLRYRGKVIGRREYSVRGGARRSLAVPISRRAARAVRRAGSLSMVLRARDRQGARSQRQVRLRA